jgi:hypothetical protein
VLTLLICFIDDPIYNGKAFLALISILNKPIIPMGECRLLEPFDQQRLCFYTKNTNARQTAMTQINRDK